MLRKMAGRQKPVYDTAINMQKLCTAPHILGSPCGGLVLTAGVEVWDGVVEGGHLSKCILVVLLS